MPKIKILLVKLILFSLIQFGYSQTSNYFPAATWLQDVHFPGTVYAGVGAPVMTDVQAHLGPDGEIMFYLKEDVARAQPLISDIKAQGRKYWVNLDAYGLEGIDVQQIIDDGQGITDPNFGVSVSLEGVIGGGRSINRVEWRNYLISCIERAIDAGAEGSQHDGATPPDASFDEEDLAAFETYLFEHSISTGDWDSTQIDFRQYLLNNGKTDANVFDTANDPQNVKDLINHWLDFKAVHTLQSWQIVRQTCYEYAQSKGQDYTIALNAASAFGSRIGQVYFAADYFIGEFFGWGNFYPMTGTVAARSRLAHAFGKRFVCWSSPTMEDISSEPNYDYGLALQSQAEMALAAQLYASGGLPQLKYPVEQTYPVFYLQQIQADLLNTVEPAASIGVIMSHAQTLRDSRGLEGLITVLQDINRSFEVIWTTSNLLDMTDNLSLATLQKYDIIFLPEVFYLTDAQRSVFLDYMNNGGTIVAVRGNVEYCGYYDEHENIQNNGTWEALVNQSTSGSFSYGNGRFINIAHAILEPSGYPPSMYGLAYTNYKADPEMNYLATSIRDTVRKWIDFALPNLEVEVDNPSAYVRFFRYQDTTNYQYIYQVTSDSVDLATRNPQPVGPYTVKLDVAPGSYNRQFSATWYSIEQPQGLTIGSGLIVDSQTGAVTVNIPQFSRWGFVHLDGSEQAPSTIRIENLTINGKQSFERQKSGSAITAQWDFASGTATQTVLEVWANLNQNGDPVMQDNALAGITPPADNERFLKSATRIHSVTLNPAATQYTVPATILQDSLVYLLRVQAWDAADSSGWLKQFFYRNAKPGRPHESQIYNALQDLWYGTDGQMSPPDTSLHTIFAINKAPGFGGDFEFDSLTYGVTIYTDSLTNKLGDSTKALYQIGTQFKHRLAWNQSMPGARGDIQDTLELDLSPYENFGIYMRAQAMDKLDSSAIGVWFGYYLDNHNDPPKPFNLLEPADGSSTDKQIPFKWINNGDPDPLNNENFTIRQVEIFFDSVATFDSPGLCSYGKDATGNAFEQDTITLNLPSNYFEFNHLLEYGKVYWKAVMWDYDQHSSDGSNSLSRTSSDVFVFYTGNGSSVLTPPNLQQPPNQAKDLPLQVDLQWQPVPDAGSYVLEVANDPNFQNILQHVENLNGTTFTLFNLNPGQSYYWRVSARNVNSQSAWSTVWNFQTMAPPPPVILVTPGPDEIVSAEQALFSWRPAGQGIKAYEFEYAETANFTNSIKNSAIADTFYTVSGLKGNKTYYWRVRASNDAGWGGFSESRKFSVVLTDIFENRDLKREFAVAQNYPNPFNPTTKVLFSLPRSERVVLQVYNLTGQLVATALKGPVNSGIHSVSIDMSNFPSGIYFYVFQAGKYHQVKKMHLIR